MLDLSESESRALQANLLERKHPQVKKHICGDEVWLAFSKRKPQRAAGLFCILIGGLGSVQVSIYFLFSNPQWAILVLLFALMLTWTGVWLVVFIKKEYVFVTSSRIAHQRINYFGRLKKILFSISLSEISGIRLYRNTIMFRAFTRSEGGDILIKKNNNKTYLVPWLEDSVSISEILMTEVSFLRMQKAAYGENKE